jgi:hypothetical protein
MDDRYVIVCLRHRDMFFGGNAYLFWGPHRSGYTAVIESAGLYSEQEAMKIADEDDVPIPLSAIDMEENQFVDLKGAGFKVLEKMTLLNCENKEVKKLINLQREKFRQMKERSA